MKEVVMLFLALIGARFPTPTVSPIVSPGEIRLAVQASLPEKYQLRLPRFEKQTFNNCGPATLAMVLARYGVGVSARELGQKIRPYQHPKGDNDDKTVFADEFARWAQKYGLKAIARPNGDMEKLKRLVNLDIPVVVKTLLHADDDIAHFRIVTGWDDSRRQIVQDDSYEGRNKKYNYDEFLKLWKPFNYSYIVVYESKQEEEVKKILGAEWDESQAWKKTGERAVKEGDKFNQVTASYHLGDYQRSIQIFEEIESKLPRRVLWYQIEPILAYYELGDYPRVFEMTDKILNDGNRAFSELYEIRGEMYQRLGKQTEAEEEFSKMMLYNANYERR